MDRKVLFSVSLTLVSILYMSALFAADGDFYVIPVGKNSYNDLYADRFIYKQDKKRYLSVPGNAFLPSASTYNYIRDGAYIKHNAAFPGTFYAPVYFPHGAKVLHLAAYVCVSDLGSITVSLLEENMTGGPTQTLKEISLSFADSCTIIGTSNPQSLETIDNKNNTYYLRASGLQEYDFPTNLRWVRIEYYISEPLP